MNTYFKNIGVAVASLWDGLRVTMGHFRNKETLNATLQYPNEKWPIPERSIGFPETDYNVIRSRLHVDINDCIGCMQCERACPVNCIKIETIKVPKEMALAEIPNGTQPTETSNGTTKKLLVTRFDIDMAECCYCNLCVYPCPEECIYMVGGPNAEKHEIDYEFSMRDRNDLVYEFATAADDEVAELAKLVGGADPRAKRQERRDQFDANLAPMAEAVDVAVTGEAAPAEMAKPKKKAITEPKIDMSVLSEIGDKMTRGLAKKAATGAVRAGKDSPTVAEIVKTAIEAAGKMTPEVDATVSKLADAIIEKPGDDAEPEAPVASEAPVPEAPTAEATTAAPAADSGKIDLKAVNDISDRIARSSAKKILSKANREGLTAKDAAAEIRAALTELGKLDDETEAILAKLEA